MLRRHGSCQDFVLVFVIVITFLRGFPVDRCLVVFFDSARTRQHGDECC